MNYEESVEKLEQQIEKLTKKFYQEEDFELKMVIKKQLWELNQQKIELVSKHFRNLQHKSDQTLSENEEQATNEVIVAAKQKTLAIKERELHEIENKLRLKELELRNKEEELHKQFEQLQALKEAIEEKRQKLLETQQRFSEEFAQKMRSIIKDSNPNQDVSTSRLINPHEVLRQGLAEHEQFYFEVEKERVIK